MKRGESFRHGRKRETRRGEETNKGGNVIWSSRLRGPSVNLTSWWWPENRFTDQDWLVVRPALEILTDSWLLSYGRGGEETGISLFFKTTTTNCPKLPRLWNRNRRLEDGWTMEIGSMTIDVKIKFGMLISSWMFWIVKLAIVVDGNRIDDWWLNSGWFLFLIIF